MRKFWCVSSFILYSLHSGMGYGQVRYAGYIVHERDQSTVPGSYTTYDLKLFLIVPVTQHMPDSISDQRGKPIYKIAENPYGINEKKVFYNYRVTSSVSGPVLIINGRFPSLIKPRNLPDDTIHIDNFYLIQPDYNASLLDTSPLSNVVFPLIIKKGQKLRFNAFNRHPEATHSWVLRDPGNVLKNLTVKPDYYTSELIFQPDDTGYYFLVSSIAMNTGAYYETSAFYTVYVAPESTEVPSGYFSSNGHSLEDKFFVVYPDSPGGTINLIYASSDADSVEFNLLPLARPYPGFSLSQSSLSPGKYSVSLSWNSLAYIHQNTNQRKGYVNILVSKYRLGKIFYETFTVSFSKDTASSLPGIAEQPMRVYPNPSMGDLMIEMPRFSHYSYLITNVAGNVLKQGSWYDKKQVIYLSGIPAGYYLLQVDGGGKTYHGKIFLRK